jgi:sugar phosphate isomerase/epimerase
MKIGALSANLRGLPFEQAMDYFVSLGVQAVEYGGFSFEDHYTLPELLESAQTRKKFLRAIEERGLGISALNTPFGNALHPVEELFQKHRHTIESVIELASLLGVDRIVAFSGLPGDSNEAKRPYWMPFYSDDGVLEWQWKEKCIPYWEAMGRFAEKRGVKICLEIMATNLVYNPPTLLRLRNEVGDVIGANLDFSHLFWQGIDPVRAIKALGDAIHHTHFKDTKIDADNCALKGVLDGTPDTDLLNRAWVFSLIGTGHGYSVWKDIVRTLKLVGYDYVLGIEHEDMSMSLKEGFSKAVQFMKDIIIEEKIDTKWF